jgi:aerobic C4-dicarboxylate transport protein
MRRVFRFNPFLQIACAIGAGVLLGFVDPGHAIQMKPLGDIFIGVVKLMVAPIVFFTVSSSLSTLDNIRQFRSIGIRMLAYFEALSALALLGGFAAASLLAPGTGFPVDLAPGSPPLPGPGHAQSLMQALAHALSASRVLQALALGVVCGIALALAGVHGARLSAWSERLSGKLFSLFRVVLKAAPVATFGAIAFTVGKHGLVSVASLLELIGTLYVASAAFIVIVLGAIARASGFRLTRFVAYIRDELMLVAGTASSMTAMPKLMEKLERAGCPKSIVGIVVPAGYSFNLNGSNIYIAASIVFLAQALGVALGPGQLLGILAVAMITSKSASGVAGAAFIALTATLAAVPEIPDSSLVLIVGIERLLKCRPLTNIIGNGVACLAISAWSGALDRPRLRSCGLDGPNSG